MKRYPYLIIFLIVSIASLGVLVYNLLHETPLNKARSLAISKTTCSTHSGVYEYDYALTSTYIIIYCNDGYTTKHLTTSVTGPEVAKELKKLKDN